MDDSILGGIILRVLGERLNGIQEVSGSIPLISTIKNSEVNCLGVFYYLYSTFSFAASAANALYLDFSSAISSTDLVFTVKPLTFL